MGIGFPKPGVVRLKGAALKKLRLAVYMRDKGRCVKCGCKVDFEGKRTDMPPMHLAHRKNKRMYGDTEANTETRCAKCHLVDGHNGGKPVRISKAQALAGIAEEQRNASK